MSKSPAKESGTRGVLSVRCLMAVLAVAVMVISCFVILNDTDDSSAANAERVYLCRSGTGEDLTPAGYLVNGDSDMYHDSDFSASYSGGVLSLFDSTMNGFYDCYNLGVGLTALYADGDLVLRISGDTPELKFCTYANDTSSARYGIYVTGNLTIINTGDVDRTLKTLIHSNTGIINHSNVGSTGIYCGGSLTIQNEGTGSFTIDAKASDKQTDENEPFSSFGIRAVNNITISDTVIDVSGGKAITTSAGIYCGGNLSVTNTKYDSLLLTATGSDSINADASNFSSYGIYAGNNISFTDTSVTATGGKACVVSAGIHSGGTVSAIKDSVDSMSVQATGSKNIYTDGTGRSGYSSFGIDASHINFEDVSVTASAANITDAPNCSSGGLVNSIGIRCTGTTNINNIVGKTTVTANGGLIDATTFRNSAYAVETSGMHVGKLNINLDSGAYAVISNGGDIYFQTGAAQFTNAGGNSYGIFAEIITNMTGGVTVNGGIAFLPVGCGQIGSYGIYSAGSITGNGCTVSATANDAVKTSCGISAGDFDTGADGEITCDAGFVPGQNGKSIGLEVRDYTGRAGSIVVCTSGIVCYPTTTTAGISARNITLNGDAYLEGNGGDTKLSYTSTTEYTTGPFKVSSGSASDSCGAKVYGNITVNGSSALVGTGGEIITQASHPIDHCTYGICMNSVACDYTITGTGTVTATGGDTKYGHGNTFLDHSIGLYCGGYLSIAQATVVATGGTVCIYVNPYDNQQSYNGSSSIGMDVGSLSLSNSAKVTVRGGDNTGHGTNNMQTYMPYYNDSYGAYIAGALSVSDSTLNAIAGKASRMAGLYVLGAITVTDSSTVDAIADSTKNEGYVRDDSNGFGRLASGILIGSSEESADITVTNSVLKSTGSTPIKAKDAGTSGNTISAAYIVESTGSNATLTETSRMFSSLSSCKCIMATYQECSVSFNGNGGSGSMDPRTELGNMILPSCSFGAPAGKTFVGWAIDSPSGTLCQPSRYIVILSDTVLYAIWDDIPTYDVSIVNDDGLTLYVKIGEAERRELTSEEISAGEVTGILQGTTVRFTAQSMEGYDLFYEIAPYGEDPSYLGTCTITVSNDTTVRFTKVAQKYTITWMSQNGEDVLETDTDVVYGTSMSYDDVAPVKANTDQYTYAFVGWATDPHMTSGTLVGDLPTAYSDMVYYAAFSETVNRYTVTWMSQNGEDVLEMDANVPYGYQPVFDSEAPTKENNEQYTYAFANWAATANQTAGVAAASLPVVTGDVTYYAAFSETVNTYTITWKSYDGTETLETDTNVAYGTKPSFDLEDPTREATEQYSYVFSGWSEATDDYPGTTEANLPTVTGDKTYYAAFYPIVNKYTVTWKSQDGNTVLETDSNVSYGYNPSFDKAAPTKDNTDQYAYAFVGWATTANQTAGVAAGSLPAVSGDVTYYAAFSVTVRTYTVTWHSQNGTVLETDSDVPYGTSVSYDSAEQTKDNTDQYTYAFVGWATSANQTAGTPAGELPTVSGDADYYAAFSETVNTFAVTLTPGTGYVITPHESSSPVDYGGSFSFTVAYAEGYTGTLVVSVNETPISAVSNIYTITGITEEKTVTVIGAQLQTFTVTFHKNDGSSNTTTQTVEYDVAENLDANTFERYGYNFNGWNTNANGTGTPYADGASIQIKSDLHLFVQWQAKQLTVTLDPNGGTVSPTSIDITYGTDYELPEPTYAGHYFNGWWKGTSPAQRINNSGKWNIVDSSVTLTAYWGTTHEITFSGGPGAEGSMDPIIVNHEGSFDLPTSSFTKAGYHFHKWSYDAVLYDAGYTIQNVTEPKEFLVVWEGDMHTVTVHYIYLGGTPARADIVQEHRTGEAYEIYSDVLTGYTADYTVVSGTMPGADVEVTVTYTPNQHTITFDSNGGSAVTQLVKGYGEAILAPISVREGYDFLGWEPALPVTMPDQDLSVVAKWSSKPVSTDGNAIAFVTDGDSATIDLSSASVTDALSDATKTTVTVTGNGWAMEISKGLISGATGQVSVSAQPLSESAKAALPQSVKDRIAGKTVYSLDLSDSSGKISFNGNKVKVSLPYELAAGDDPNNVKVFFIDGENLVQYDATYDSDKKVAVFEADHFSDWFVDVVEPSGNNGGGFPIWIVFVIIAVVAVAGAGAFFLTKKKA